MKKIILFVIVIFGYTILNSQMNLSYGVKAGCTMANQKFDFTDYELNHETQYRYGFDVCFFMEIFNQKTVSLLVETHYLQKGMNKKITILDEEIFGGSYTKETTNRIDYLALPFLAKLKFKFVHSSLYLIAGPQFDILLGYNTKYYTVPYKDFNKFDLSASMGMGYEFQIRDFNILLLEFRYSPSFTNSYETELVTINNNCFQFLTGIKF
ncbi:MAG: PorT family protein [Candidatus Lokiarchaeota archaeon]|nr:PorT family protein [Candidatus Lokiarchaeota archaeon]